MMTLLARGFSWLVGAPRLATLAALAGVLVMGHQLWLARDERLRTQGRVQCEAEWQLAAAKAERDAARAAAARLRTDMETERQLTETLRHERLQIAREFDRYKVAASSDPRCLSDGVLDLLRGGDGKVDGSREGGKSSEGGRPD